MELDTKYKFKKAMPHSECNTDTNTHTHTGRGNVHSEGRGQWVREGSWMR